MSEQETETTRRMVEETEGQTVEQPNDGESDAGDAGGDGDSTGDGDSE